MQNILLQSAGGGTGEVLSGKPGNRFAVAAVQWSLSAVPTAASFTISSEGSEILKKQVRSAGPGSMQFPVPKLGVESGSLSIEIAVLGASMTLNVDLL